MKIIDNIAGKGCWKKQMPFCNDMDTDCNIIWHENEQTSNGSFFVRKFVELKLK